jgi:hypothetical protein
MFVDGLVAEGMMSQRSDKPDKKGSDIKMQIQLKCFFDCPICCSSRSAETLEFLSTELSSMPALAVL